MHGIEWCIPQLNENLIIEKIDDKGNLITSVQNYEGYKIFYLHKSFYFDFDKNCMYFNITYDYSICDFLNAMLVQHLKLFSFFIDKNDIKKVKEIIDNGLVKRIEDIRK